MLTSTFLVVSTLSVHDLIELYLEPGAGLKDLLPRQLVKDVSDVVRQLR